jgi:hypothetical protein
MPVVVHNFTVTCDQTKPMATLASITPAGSGFAVSFMTTSLGGGVVTFPRLLSLTEIITVNYTIPGSAGTGSFSIASDDPASPFIVNITVTG